MSAPSNSTCPAATGRMPQIEFRQNRLARADGPQKGCNRVVLDGKIYALKHSRLFAANRQIADDQHDAQTLGTFSPPGGTPREERSTAEWPESSLGLPAAMRTP